MTIQIDRQTIEEYEATGTALIRGAFADWVQPLVEAVETVIHRHRNHDAQEVVPGYGFQNSLRVIEDFGGGAMGLNLFAHHANFTDWLKQSPAAEMAAGMMQSSEARFWIDASFRKEAACADEGTPWHNDTCTWPFWGQQMSILWIALTDIAEEDGPLQTVRGTHRGDGRYYSTFFPQTASPPAPYKPWDNLLAQAESGQIDTWTMAAGDVLVFHPTTIHGSLPRQSSGSKPRLSFSTRWLGDDVVWKPDSLTAPMTERINANSAMTPGASPPDSVIPVSWPR